MPRVRATHKGRLYSLSLASTFWWAFVRRNWEFFSLWTLETDLKIKQRGPGCNNCVKNGITIVCKSHEIWSCCSAKAKISCQAQRKPWTLVDVWNYVVCCLTGNCLLRAGHPHSRPSASCQCSARVSDTLTQHLESCTHLTQEVSGILGLRWKFQRLSWLFFIGPV